MMKFWMIIVAACGGALGCVIFLVICYCVFCRRRRTIHRSDDVETGRTKEIELHEHPQCVNKDDNQNHAKRSEAKRSHFAKPSEAISRETTRPSKLLHGNILNKTVQGVGTSQAHIVSKTATGLQRQYALPLPIESVSPETAKTPKHMHRHMSGERQQSDGTTLPHVERKTAKGLQGQHAPQIEFEPAKPLKKQPEKPLQIPVTKKKKRKKRKKKKGFTSSGMILPAFNTQSYDQDSYDDHDDDSEDEDYYEDWNDYEDDSEDKYSSPYVLPRYRNHSRSVEADFHGYGEAAFREQFLEFLDQERSSCDITTVDVGRGKGILDQALREEVDHEPSTWYIRHCIPNSEELRVGYYTIAFTWEAFDEEYRNIVGRKPPKSLRRKRRDY